ncbi:MAG: response regulator transcription factor [Clostridiales Family XIII bacterium]|jgi:DNA-binding response OmpR family regulator|nr:response regulator transcription factor [Clostridiales Family XIII bacterium]
MSHIMVVDDDEYIRELVSALLIRDGFTVSEATDGRDALKKLGGGDVDLLIADVMMPEMDGFELLGYVRKYYEDMPVLMLTAKSDVSQKVKGFETGADDYLTKPFEPAELIVRVKALLRRYNISQAQSVRIGDLVLDRGSYTVTVMVTVNAGTDGDAKASGESGSMRMDIPMKEFELLFKLASAEGQTFTRDTLIEDLWGWDFDGNERTLDVHVGRLRERFPADKYHFKITTIRGIGYRAETVK